MRKTNFLGIPVNVMDDADIDAERESGELHLYGVMRVADTHYNDSRDPFVQRRQRTICEDCGQVCYFDPKQFDQLRGMNLRIICTRCLARTADSGNAPTEA